MTFMIRQHGMQHMQRMVRLKEILVEFPFSLAQMGLILSV